MKLLARLAVVSLVGLTALGCGSSDTDKKAEDKPADTTSSSSPSPTESESPAADDSDYPTDASVADYCKAFKGDGSELEKKPTTAGELTDFMETMYKRMKAVGIPANFTAAEKKAYEQQDAQLRSGIDALAAIDPNKTVEELRKDTALSATMDEKFDTPKALSEYSAKNCK